jgi:hypothetical protein
LDAVEKREISCPCQESNPGRPARNPSLNQLKETLTKNNYLVSIEINEDEANTDADTAEVLNNYSIKLT